MSRSDTALNLPMLDTAGPFVRFLIPGIVVGLLTDGHTGPDHPDHSADTASARMRPGCQR
ncbi:hypothetical protein A5741_20800 [Mycolicibacterium conceptionense]|uniref:Uncharacterized protein n=1 Tax=Mycolicibacterium senegalense TaxID=1796 RepID=A0ABR5FMD0_9MYCO|nr:hypothetical protein AA982_04425 [Mycolicibacterium senegalense]KLO47696.1 hypothetical protein ABW05_31445 [Mycolicibacterium senegalense]OMB84066.1 hypothetical protein A5741_20800 [Mycolicibacterium conceptionense]